ncbi:MAG: UDP-N-acetylmuramoyl-L-alanyl-D-glutamate--2,6-diaminopimelate ligase [Pirellulaceae bacterium]
MQQLLQRARGISLRDTLPQGRIYGGDDIHAMACSSDWRTCRSGDLFVALVGADSDGHDQVHTAIENGASAVLAERPLPIGVPTCVVDDTREAFGQVCQSLAGRPSRQMRVVGVTGTNGKTITTLLITAVMEAAGRITGTTNTLTYRDGYESTPAHRTTPSAPELADWMARMVACGCSEAVVEVSSRALAQRRTAGVEFDAAVLTNVRRDHLDFHGSVMNYRRAKQRLLEQLSPHGFAVINADDPASQFILSKIDHPVLTIGMQSAAEVTATVIERLPSEQTFLLCAGNETVPVRTAMIGDHHVYNCLSAAAVGLAAGIDLMTVARGLESVNHIPGRMERLECGQPFGVYVDSAHTPDTLAVALKTLRQTARGRVICVYGAVGERGHEQRPLLGRVVERGADRGIITSDNPGFEEPLAIAHDILDGYDRPARAWVRPNRAAAIELALSEAKPGDAVLIAGKGQQNFQLVEGGRLSHDDREVARNWLYQVGAQIDYPTDDADTIAFDQSWN